MRRFSGKCALSVAAALTGIMMFGAAPASAATCGQAGSGTYTEVGSVIVGSVCYTAYSDSVYSEWSAAQAFAQSLGSGNLATITTQAQYDALAGLLASLGAFNPVTGADYTGAYIGLRTTDNGFTPSTVASLKWVDGTVNTFVATTNNLWQGGAGPGTALSNYNPSGCGNTGTCLNIYALMSGAGGLGTVGAYSADNPSLMIGAIVESIVTTPLPAALPLFAGGIGVVGLLLRRGKRKGAVTA